MPLLYPTSIAVIGASADEKKVGHLVLKNLLTQGYKGKVYAVNPRGEEILGIKAHPSLGAIDGTVDLAVIITPAPTVPGLLEECGQKKIKTVIVISAGFGETGTPEGRKLEEELIAIAKRHSIALIGPNCLGVIRPSIGMNASFANNLEGKGTVALLSQSGALAVALLDESERQGLEFSLVISMGNKATMDECDFLELCKNDPETHAIGIYVESIKNGKKFLQVARDVAAIKPVVLIKSGTSERGKKAVSSHTGALAGSDAAIEAVCAQTGVRRAKDTGEFLDLLRALEEQPALLSPRIAIITNAGGPGILATDAAEKEQLILAELEPKNAEALKKFLPAAASVKNPIDVLGDALADRYGEALDACGKDPNIDGVVALITPQVMTPVEDIAEAIVTVHKKYPLMPIVAGFMGEENVRGGITILQKNGIPNYSTPERAVRAISALQHVIPSSSQLAASVTRDLSLRKPQSGFLLEMTKGLLPENITAELFTAYNLPLPSSAIAHSADEAAGLAEKIGYPVVAKISSPDILHKTDIGCVKVNVNTADEARSAFLEIEKNAKKNAPTAKINGVLIQKLLLPGDEFIVGAIKDPNFGHLIMAGLGGIYTELFRDTAFRIAPIDEETAYRMLQGLRSWKMLLGLRGKEQSDIHALAKIIAVVSRLVTDYPQIKELDLNPVIVRPDGVAIADAKVIVE